jgi:uncharacterized integral membrane protein
MTRFLSRLFGWIVAVAALAIAIAFAVGNKHPIPVVFEPDLFTLEAPLYAIVFTAVFIGLLIGGFTAWKRAGRWRRLARQRGRMIAELEAENRALRAEAATPANAAAVPALPKESLPAESSRADAA